MGFGRSQDISGKESLDEGGNIMSNVIEAIRRGTTALAYKLQANKQDHLFTVNYLPKYAELVNEGNVWQAKSATTASVIAVPTTASILGLQNSDADGGKSMVILAAGAIQIASPASECTLALIHNPQKLAAAAFTADVTPTNLKPRVSTYGGIAIVDNAPTVVADGWYPLGVAGHLAIASLFGANLWVNIDGLVVIPPGGSWALSCIANAVTVTVQIAVVWTEVQL